MTSAPIDEPRPASVPLTPFVGRQHELASLRAALARACSGRGELVLLAGEAGIGKTRLAEELASIATTQGAGVFWGRGAEWDGTPPYWPWLQMLRALVHATAADALRLQLGSGATAIAQLLPELREQLPDLLLPPAVEPEQARFQLFEAIRLLLSNSARDRPLVLVFDDMHWADQPSLLLLRFFAREIRDVPMLLIGAYRGVEVGRHHSLLEVLTDLAREPASQRMLLRGLVAADIASYLARIAGHDPPAALVEAVTNETEGNPFFVTEVVRLLVADGKLAHAAATGTVRVPESVREVIARRFERLSPGCAEVLARAAVVGREFSLPVLESSGHLTADALLDVLDEAVAAQIVQAQSAIGRYRFSHVLFQETLYDGLSIAQRVRLHARIGDALEQLSAADPEPVLADLARHFFQAAPLGRAAKAIAYAVQAAEQATTQLAWEDAVGHYQRALQAFELLDQPDERQRIEIFLALSEAQFLSGDAKAATVTRRHALPLIRKHGTRDQLIRAAVSRGMGGWGYPFADRDTRLLLEAVVEALPSYDAPQRVQALSRLATALHHVRDSLPRRIALSAEAVAMAQRLGDPATLGFALIAQIPTFWDPDQRERWRSALAACARLVERSDDLLLTSFIHLGHEMLAMEAGDVQQADRRLRAYADIRNQLRLPSSLWEVITRRAGRALMEGRFADAERLASEAYALGERVYPVEWQPKYERESLLFLLRHLQGRLADIEPVIRQFLEQNPDDGYWRCRLALAAAEQGNLDEARATFEQVAADDFAQVTFGPWWHANLPPLIETCVRLADTRRAATLLRIMEPFADRNIHEISIYYGSGAHYQGLLATLLARWSDARRYFEDALIMNARLQARPLLARTQLAYAALLAARGEPRDLVKASDLAADALVAARALGMAPLVQQVQALGDAIASSRRPPEYPAGLTQREVDVLRLLAAGQSNREIADALCVSVRTAERHIANLYIKIDAGGRAEAIAFAHRHGLT